MNVASMEEFLFNETESELNHLNNNSLLSKRYKNIPKVRIDDKDIYLFKFDTLLKNNNVSIHKESRFTHIPLHIHTVIELSYVYSGECTQIISGKEIHMKQGSICLLDTNVPHEIKYLNSNDIIISIVMRKQYFSTSFLSRLGKNSIINDFLINALSDNTTHDQYLLLDNCLESNIHSIIQNILCENYEKQLCRNEIIDSYMVILFCEMLRLYQDKKYNIDSSKSTNLLFEILSYIENNYHDITLEKTAAHFSFHPNYLSSFIKKNTGRSFKNLVIMQKMSEACFYLTNSDMPIYEIANTIGYDNLGFFYKKFQSIYNLSPQEYRNNYS